MGDSPILGAGLYVDGAVGAAGSTGRGEANLYNLSSYLIVENLRRGMRPKDAGMEALKRIRANTVEKRLLDAQGNPRFQLELLRRERKGEYAGVSMYAARRQEPVRFAVCTEKGPETLACEPARRGARRVNARLPPNGAAPAPPLFTPRFFMMCGFTFTVFLSLFQLLPTAPFRILDLGGSTAVAGLSSACSPTPRPCSAPITGALADRMGKRRMLLITSLAIACFSVAYALSRTFWLPLVLVFSTASSGRAPLRLLGLHDRGDPGEPARRGDRLLGHVHHARDRGGPGGGPVDVQARLGLALRGDRPPQPGDGRDRLAPAPDTNVAARRSRDASLGARSSSGGWRR